MRKLNGFYAIETLNARLNGSSKDVEIHKNNYDNSTYTKKIGNRSKISSQCQKFGIKEFMSQMSGSVKNAKTKEGKQIKGIYDPFNSEIDDIFGYMIADKIKITEEEYNKLDEKKKGIFNKVKKEYHANITKKRKSRLQMNALINVSNNKIRWEYNVASSTTNSLPYEQEVYSGVHTSIFNLNIDDIGKFYISNDAAEFRDYDEEEATLLGVRNLEKSNVYERIENVLNGIEHLAISSCQTNHLTDTKPKFVILADYSWGNNAFQGILKESGVDIEMLKECIEQNEEYRLSKIYIGVNKFFDDNYNNIKEELENEFSNDDFIVISNVKEAFSNYKEELKKNIVDM